MADGLFPPATQSVSLKPQAKGMISNGSGGAKRICNMTVEPTGLRRRSAWVPAFGFLEQYGPMPLEVDEIVQDVIPYWSSGSAFSYVAVTDRRLLRLLSTSTTWETVPFDELEYTIASSTATTLTVTGAHFLTNKVRIGDRALVTPYTEAEATTLMDFSTLANMTASDVADGVQCIMSASVSGSYATLGMRQTSMRHGKADDVFTLRLRIDSGSVSPRSVTLAWYSAGAWHTTSVTPTFVLGSWVTVSFPMTDEADYVGAYIAYEMCWRLYDWYPNTATINYSRVLLAGVDVDIEGISYSEIGSAAFPTETADGALFVLNSDAPIDGFFAGSSSKPNTGFTGDVFSVRLRLVAGAEGSYQIGVRWITSVPAYGFYTKLQTTTLYTNRWTDVVIEMPTDATYVRTTFTSVGLYISDPVYPMSVEVAYVYLHSAQTSIAITSVAEETLTFDNLPVTMKDTFALEHRFTPADTDIVDYAEAPGYLIFTDNSVDGLVKYDGDVASAFGQHAADGDPDADYLVGARTVMYFAGLVWLGCTQEASDNGRRRIRWSSLTDLTEFAAVDYIDFIGEDTKVLRLASNENVPVVFFEEAIYTGYASELTPFAFIRVESGKASLAGAHAVAGARGGLFFIGKDNFYFLSTGRQGTAQTVSCQAIGTDITNESVDCISSFVRAQVFYAQSQEQMWFVLPSAKNYIWRIFVFSFRTNAWSYFDSPAEKMVALARIPSVASAYSWDDYDAMTWASQNAVAWSSLKTQTEAQSLCAVDRLGVAYIQHETGDRDQLVTAGALVPAIVGVDYISDDFDFDQGDAEKVLTRLALQIGDLPDTTRSVEMALAVDFSRDFGRTWERKGTLTIMEDAYDNEVHCRFRARALRFRLSTVQMPLCEMQDIRLRIRPGEGLHNARDAQ